MLRALSEIFRRFREPVAGDGGASTPVVRARASKRARPTLAVRGAPNGGLGAAVVGS
jgi:hypothetical protein